MKNIILILIVLTTSCKSAFKPKYSKGEKFKLEYHFLLLQYKSNLNKRNNFDLYSLVENNNQMEKIIDTMVHQPIFNKCFLLNTTDSLVYCIGHTEKKQFVFIFKESDSNNYFLYKHNDSIHKSIYKNFIHQYPKVNSKDKKAFCKALSDL